MIEADEDWRDIQKDDTIFLKENRPRRTRILSHTEDDTKPIFSIVMCQYVDPKTHIDFTSDRRVTHYALLEYHPPFCDPKKHYEL